MKNIQVFSGGGGKGIISLRLAARLIIEPHLVAGTSTGAIIAGAKALGYNYEQILDLYLDNIKDIFKPSTFSFEGLTSSKYQSKNLQKVIRKIFGVKTNKDCVKDLMINAYDITNKKPKYWKSWDDETWLLSDAIIASCSAPTYFEPYKLNGIQYVDGGMDSNNICDGALVEGLGKYQDDIDLVLIGTGECKDSKKKIKSGGILNWGTYIIDIMLDANQKSSIYKTQEIIKLRGDLDYFQVLNIDLDEEIMLDDLTKIKYMLNLKI